VNELVEEEKTSAWTTATPKTMEKQKDKVEKREQKEHASLLKQLQQLKETNTMLSRALTQAQQ